MAKEKSIMMIWFKCREDNLMVGLETDTKPSVGDTILIKMVSPTILIKGIEFIVKKVIWCLEEPPAQSAFLIEISKTN